LKPNTSKKKAGGRSPSADGKKKVPKKIGTEQGRDRSGQPAIRGFLYQFVLTAVRWRALEDDETLLIEHTEDVDILKDDFATIEQIKLREGEPVAAGDLWESVGNFLNEFIARPRTRFVFTASTRRPTPHNLVLRAWLEGDAPAAAALRAAAATELDLSGVTDDQLNAFVKRVDWVFSDTSLDQERKELRTIITADFKGSRLDGVDTFIEALLGRLLLRSAESDLLKRTFRRRDYDWFLSDWVLSATPTEDADDPVFGLSTGSDHGHSCSVLVRVTSLAAAEATLKRTRNLRVVLGAMNISDPTLDPSMLPKFDFVAYASIKRRTRRSEQVCERDVLFHAWQRWPSLTSTTADDRGGWRRGALRQRAVGIQEPGVANSIARAICGGLLRLQTGDVGTLDLIGPRIRFLHMIDEGAFNTHATGIWESFARPSSRF
jgi:hypothetical protein